MSFESELHSVISDIERLLVEKNQSYGNSALDPISCFCDLSVIDRLNVRIDDKINRMMKGNEFKGDDTVVDLIGYLILLLIAKKNIVTKGGSLG